MHFTSNLRTGNKSGSTYTPRTDLAFWFMLLGATALGEKLGDVFSLYLDLGYGTSSLLLAVLTVIALIARLFLLSDRVLVYWGVIVLTSTIGTTAADFVTRTLGLGYLAGSALLILSLVLLVLSGRHWPALRGGTTARWRISEGLFWTEFTIAGALGTASADSLATTAQLGFFTTGALLGSGTLILWVLAQRNVSRLFLYWMSVLLIDPLGATLGDYLDKPGGLGLGVANSAAILACVLGLVIVASSRREAEWTEAKRQSQPGAS